MRPRGALAPEFPASIPSQGLTNITGHLGTNRWLHTKTGHLEGVRVIAGYASDDRHAYVVVVLLNYSGAKDASGAQAFEDVLETIFP